MNKETLTIIEAGELMNVHPNTVLDLIGQGVVPAGKIGRAYVLLRRDVLSHIENQIIQQTAERLGARFGYSPPIKNTLTVPPRRRGAGRR